MFKHKLIVYFLLSFFISNNIFANENKFVPKNDKMLLIIGQDKETIQKEITLFREEVNDLNNIINYIEYVTPSNLVY